ncbi:hypothetical protein Taro_005851 [Colocasia esculenta]|uniref:Uncharacterized protein n=1 Tax=Colocasia esculenta TaxID=4460 RepID=A0A843TVW3_COLES|nr:hypothetical protein [Colocasia esculenta]
MHTSATQYHSGALPPRATNGKQGKETHTISLFHQREGDKTTAQDWHFHKKHSPPNTHYTHQTTIWASTQDARKQSKLPAPWGHTKSTSTVKKTWKRTTRQAGQRNSQMHGQVHNALTENAQADCNTDSPTGNNDSSSLQREQRQPKQHEAALGRTSTKSAKSHPGRTSPERSPTKRHTSNHRGNTTYGNNRNEHGTALGETLTRTTTNGYGKPHQNIGQPSDAPQPRGQCNSNQKRAQHSSRETSLPPEPTEKDSGSTSPELTTSQHQADNNHRQVSQRSTNDATRHTERLLNNADQAEHSAQRRTNKRPPTQDQHNTHRNNKGAANKAETPSTNSTDNSAPVKATPHAGSLSLSGTHTPNAPKTTRSTAPGLACKRPPYGEDHCQRVHRQPRRYGTNTPSDHTRHARGTATTAT